MAAPGAVELSKPATCSPHPARLGRARPLGGAAFFRLGARPPPARPHAPRLPPAFALAPRRALWRGVVVRFPLRLSPPQLLGLRFGISPARGLSPPPPPH